MSLASRSQSMEDGMDEGKECLNLFKDKVINLKCKKYLFISDVFRRSHRLSLPGHSQRMTNYLKFLQELAVRQVYFKTLPHILLSFLTSSMPIQAMGGGLNSQLFSTAVISGSSSSPNLGPRNNCRGSEYYKPVSYHRCYCGYYSWRRWNPHY